MGERRAGSAGQADRGRAAPPGLGQGADHPGRGPTGGDADDDIPFAHRRLSHHLGAGPGVVLCAFHRSTERDVAPGDEPLDPIGRDAIGGGHLGSVEHAETAAGARPQVEETTALPQTGGDQIHRPGYLRELLAHGAGDPCVLVVDQGDDLERGEGVDVCRARVGLLGDGGGLRCYVHCVPSIACASRAAP